MYARAERALGEKPLSYLTSAFQRLPVNICTNFVLLETTCRVPTQHVRLHIWVYLYLFYAIILEIQENDTQTYRCVDEQSLCYVEV